MNRHKNFVTFAVNSNRVVVIGILVWCWSKLDIDVFSNASREHAFLIVPYFEIGSLRRQYVQPLGRRRIIKDA